MDKGKVFISPRFVLNFSDVNLDNLEEEVNSQILVLEQIFYVLGRLNSEGVFVKSTFCIENSFTLDYLIKNRPDILAKIKERVKMGDEIEAMGYSGTVLNLCNKEELDFALKWLVSNEKGTGLNDVFGSFSPIIRTANFNMSPNLISHLKSIGLYAMSLSYTRVPKTTITSFIDELSTVERYNPITYVNKNTMEKIVGLLSISSSDIFSFFTLSSYLKNIYSDKNFIKSEKDVLVLVDFVLSSKMYFGFKAKIEVGKNQFMKISGKGLYKMLKKLQNLDFVNFTTPYEYLKTHDPIAEIDVSLDLFEGKFEGLSSITEKHQSTQIFTLIERARAISHRAKQKAIDKKIDITNLLNESIEKRVLALSSSSFSPANDEIFESNFKRAVELSTQSLNLAQEAYDKVKDEKTDQITLEFDNDYFYSTESVDGLVKLSREGKTEKYLSNNTLLPSFLSPFDKSNYVIADGKSNLKLTPIEMVEVECLMASDNKIQNQFIKIEQIPYGAVKIFYKGNEIVKRGFRPQIKFKNKLIRGVHESVTCANISCGQTMKIEGKIQIKGFEEGRYTYIFTLLSNIPSVYVNGEIVYPVPKSQIEKKNFVEVLPMELFLDLSSTPSKGFKVTYHNFLGDQKLVSLSNTILSQNKNIDSLNNFATAGYLAISDGERGILVGENLNEDFNFAFCPIRIHNNLGDLTVKLNPFGTYHGKQLKNKLARTNVSSIVTQKRNKMFNSYAKTYAGQKNNFSLILSPFLGETPSDEMIKRAYLMNNLNF